MSIMPLSEFSGEKNESRENRVMRWRERYYRQESCIAALKAQRDELLAEVEEWRAIKAAYQVEYAARPNKLHPNQYHGHAHDVDGVWDSDNGALAGCQCAACMVHRAAIAKAEGARDGQ